MNYEVHTYTSSRGEQVSFRDGGRGRPVVLLHSGIPGATAERDFAANIRSLGGHNRLILVDLPLSGSMPPAAGAVSLTGASVGELLAHLHVDQASVIGNGFGGEVALNLAARTPGAVRHLVLIAPTGCRFSPFTPVPMEGLKAVSSYWVQPSPARMTNVLRLLRPDATSPVDAEAVERHNAVTFDVPVQVPIKADDDALLLAPLITARTLLIWGREDRFSPLDYGLNLLARIPDARFHLLPSAGHNAQLDAAIEVNALLQDFLEAPS